MASLTMGRARHAAAAALAVALAAMSPTAASAQFGGPAAVTVAEATARDVVDEREVIGRLIAPVESAVAARAAGVIETTLVQVGDRVTAGQPIAEIDATLLDIDRRSAMAALERAAAATAAAEARLALSRQALERAERLRGSTAFSLGTYDDLTQTVAEAVALIAQARADEASAEAALARVEYDLEHAVIRAPFDGVVIDRAAQPGQYIAVGAEAARLLDVAALEIEADVPATMVGGLLPGVEVVAVMSGDVETTAVVRAVIPSESASTRTRPVRFEIDLSHALDRVAAGAAVTLRLPVDAPRQALSAPKDALVQGPGGWIVFVVEGGVATPRPVTIGVEVGDSVEILSGLAPGDLVVIRGNERLRPGQPVTPFFVDGSPAAPESEDPAEPAVDDDDA